MKVRFVVALAGAAIGFALSAFADEVPPAAAAQEDTNASNNAANSTTEPKFTFQYWNYYATSLNEVSGNAENRITPIQPSVYPRPP